MRYLLETDIVSNLVRNPQGRLADRVKAIGEQSICTSIIVAAELRYGTIRTQLESAGTPIGGNGLLIAAQALALGHTLVMDNDKGFYRIDGLRVENWLTD